MMKNKNKYRYVCLGVAEEGKLHGLDLRKLLLSMRDIAFAIVPVGQMLEHKIVRGHTTPDPEPEEYAEYPPNIINNSTTLSGKLILWGRFEKDHGFLTCEPVWDQSLKMRGNFFCKYPGSGYDANIGNDVVICRQAIKGFVFIDERLPANRICELLMATKLDRKKVSNYPEGTV